MTQLTSLNIDGETVLVSTFVGKNRSSNILEWHQRVFEHYKVPVNYISASFELGISYGRLIDHYVNSVIDSVDYFIFFDMDAMPLKKEGIRLIIDKIKDKNTIWGISQQSTHILKNGTPIHPYAGFSSCGFSKELYLKLGKPTFSETPRGDIGEELTWRCEELGFNVCLSYPTEFHELTEEEMKNTGNAKHGWVNNGIKLGLGTTFGGIFYHSFHQAVIPGTQIVAIPRSVEIFISKAKQILNINKVNSKERKLELVAGCVNTSKIKYSDFLKISLPINKKHFDNILISTTESDHETQRVCLENGVSFFCTDEFFSNGSKYDNNRAISASFKNLKHKDWVIATTPDMIYPDDFRESLNLESLSEDNMYGTSRAFINTHKDWLDYESGDRKIESFETIEGWGCGFCQIFNLNSIKLKNVPLDKIMPSNGQATESDIWFLKRFHPDVRNVGKLPIVLIHLGHKDYGGTVRSESEGLIPFFFDNKQ